MFAGMTIMEIIQTLLPLLIVQLGLLIEHNQTNT